MNTHLFTAPLYASRKRRSRTRTLTSIVLPCLPQTADCATRDIYMSFIRALREAPHRRMEVRILTAIHAAADRTQNSDAYTTRVLVDLGLLAPRLALPGDFLDHVDACVWRDRPLVSMPSGYDALLRHWDQLGENLYGPQAGRQSPESLHSFLNA